MKKFILILMSVFTISAFGSFAIPDDDVGDPVVMVDHDVDQSVVVATVDVMSIKTHSVDQGSATAIQMIQPANDSIFITHKPDDDVGWMDEMLITTKKPPSQNQFGSAGGNPGWCG